MVLPTETAGTKGDRTRQRLLEIAVRRFAADGFRRTSVSDIARDADLTPAAVYAYFAGKDALFQAAVDADASALIDVEPGRGRRAADARGRGHDGRRARRAGRRPPARGAGAVRPGARRDRPAARPAVAATADRRGRGRASSVAQAAGEIRADVDARTIAEGLESIVLSLLMSSLQAGVRAVVAPRDPARARCSTPRCDRRSSRPPRCSRAGLDRRRDRPQDARHASSGGPPRADGGRRRRGSRAGVGRGAGGGPGVRDLRLRSPHAAARALDARAGVDDRRRVRVRSGRRLRDGPRVLRRGARARPRHRRARRSGPAISW